MDLKIFVAEVRRKIKVENIRMLNDTLYKGVVKMECGETSRKS